MSSKPISTFVALVSLVVGFVAASSALIASHARAQTQERQLTIDVGSQETVSAIGVERYSEGAPGIVDVRVTEREFVIVALRPGTTSLVLFYANGRQVQYTVNVRDPNATVVRPGSVSERETIRLDLYFVELNETYNHQIGLGFPGTIGGQGSGQGNIRLDFVNPGNGAIGPLSQASLALVNQVLPRIDLAQSQGWARLRRQTMIVTANGTPARFNTGGEVNIAVTSGFSARVRTIRFGSELSMTPRFDAQTGRIEIQITADLSELTESEQAGGIPGRRRTELETVANLVPGQAMMMSGVTSRSESETQGGLPGLSQIPIIGVLFGTNQRRGEATHNVLFIVPTIVQSVPRAQRNYITEAFETFERFSGFIHDQELIERIPPGYGQPGGRGPGVGDQ
ncbi:MAG: pilus assembly protein N-terminal domain-containing protein [Sandaracinaceae bacterium]